MGFKHPDSLVRIAGFVNGEARIFDKTSRVHTKQKFVLHNEHGNCHKIITPDPANRSWRLN